MISTIEPGISEETATYLYCHVYDPVARESIRSMIAEAKASASNAQWKLDRANEETAGMIEQVTRLRRSAWGLAIALGFHVAVWMIQTWR